jgi:hypothetical protein
MIDDDAPVEPENEHYYVAGQPLAMTFALLAAQRDEVLALLALPADEVRALHALGLGLVRLKLPAEAPAEPHPDTPKISSPP